jgi:hypothetical protein
LAPRFRPGPAHAAPAGEKSRCRNSQRPSSISARA